MAKIVDVVVKSVLEVVERSCCCLRSVVSLEGILGPRWSASKDPTNLTSTAGEGVSTSNQE